MVASITDMDEFLGILEASAGQRVGGPQKPSGFLPVIVSPTGWNDAAAIDDQPRARHCPSIFDRLLPDELDRTVTITRPGAASALDGHPEEQLQCILVSLRKCAAQPLRDPLARSKSCFYRSGFYFGDAAQGVGRRSGENLSSTCIRTASAFRCC